jgi:hypothetical protein
MHSHAIRTLSIINLPGTKALCSSAMMLGSTLFSLLAETFEAVLYKTLHRLIGQKFISLSVLDTFGIRTIIVSHKPSGISSPPRKSLTALHISFSKIDQCFSWNIAGKPSGLGAFVGPI